MQMATLRRWTLFVGLAALAALAGWWLECRRRRSGVDWIEGGHVHWREPFGLPRTGRKRVKVPADGGTWAVPDATLPRPDDSMENTHDPLAPLLARVPLHVPEYESEESWEQGIDAVEPAARGVVDAINRANPGLRLTMVEVLKVTRSEAAAAGVGRGQAVLTILVQEPEREFAGAIEATVGGTGGNVRITKLRTTSKTDKGGLPAFNAAPRENYSPFEPAVLTLKAAPRAG